MGEFELLARIRERLPAPSSRIRLGSGDDAAITVPGRATATSVDALVDGVHFRRDLATPEQIGHKALATALSDLAAMGAEPGEAYVVLGIPPDFADDDCIELLDGMIALAQRTGTALAGGDLTRAGELFLAVTVVGHAPDPDSLIHRGGAGPGDALVLTGEIGAAAAGLQLLEASDCAINHAIRGSIPRSASNWEEALRARQLQPIPRLGAGQALARAGATAMIDLSDGLGSDAGHIAKRSGVGLRIDAESIPLAAGSKKLMAAVGRDPWELLSGGEDYELLATIPPERLTEAQRRVQEGEKGIALTEIGVVVAGSGVEIRLPGGRLLEPAGFDQLA
ncbi:MAG: thiamine-monophosphate kinase [Solirubrobacterales bacterium]|jgi:thiamine-monophosphate kinase|nr:thiamine-monophosphate kinase [Solirubrobacterales bacterium]